MKKLKLVLTATAIFAVVGGALAVKTSNYNGNLVCTSDPDGAGNTEV
jgi:hypothetical protein